MTEIVMPNDTNPTGTIFGGRVMQLMDVAASIAGFRHARCPVVTLSVDSLEFQRPIRLGGLVVLHAWLNWAGRTSMEVQVEVYSEDLLTGVQARTSTAYFTFVAVDGDGRPTPVPALLTTTEDEEKRYREAAARRADRLRRKQGEDE